MAILSLRLLSFVCCLLVINIFIPKASGADVSGANVTPQQFHYFCNRTRTNGARSDFTANLKTLLSKLTSNKKINYGFYNSSYGRNTNKVNAIGMCRGDMKPDQCRDCLSHATANLTQLCPKLKEAIGWYEDEKCMLRYSNRLIFDLEEVGPAYYAWNAKNATNVNQFNKVVKNLLNSLRSKAASGDSHSKYGAGSVSGPNNQTVYGLVQCTPDLSGRDCRSCLAQSIQVLPNCCSGKIGARVIRPSCNIRYETSFRFYEPSTRAPPSGPK